MTYLIAYIVLQPFLGVIVGRFLKGRDLQACAKLEVGEGEP